MSFKMLLGIRPDQFIFSHLSQAAIVKVFQDTATPWSTAKGLEPLKVVQHVSGATHEQGHMLGLVLSYRLSVCNIEFGDIAVSDHKPVLFGRRLSVEQLNLTLLLSAVGLLNLSACHFSAAFIQFRVSDDSAETELISWFNFTILDIKQPGAKPEQWCRDSTHGARQECCAGRTHRRFHFKF